MSDSHPGPFDADDDAQAHDDDDADARPHLMLS